MKIALLFLAATAAVSALEVGAAKRTVTPDLKAHAPVNIAGFGNGRAATAIKDELYARCMAFRAGDRPLVICGVDSIGLFFDDVKRIRAKVPAADVVVTSTHDHEAPDTMGLWGGIVEAYNTYVIERTAEAAKAAIANLAPATLRIAKEHRAELDDMIADTRPPVRHDSELLILMATNTDGKVIGTLVNWANHPEAMGSKNTEISADYLAHFHPVMEARSGGVSVFCNGAVGGMQSPLGAKIAAPETVGKRVAEIASDTVAKVGNVNIASIGYREKLIPIPMSNPGFQAAAKAGIFAGRKTPLPDGTSPTPVGYIRFDGPDKKPVLEIALIPGEMYPELSVGGVERYAGADFPDAPVEPAIKQQMTAPYRMLFGLANDEIGYIIPKAEWDEKAPWLQNAQKKWYGEVNSIGPEAAPMIAKAFGELVNGK